MFSNVYKESSLSVLKKIPKANSQYTETSLVWRPSVAERMQLPKRPSLPGVEALGKPRFGQALSLAEQCGDTTCPRAADDGHHDGRRKTQGTHEDSGHCHPTRVGQCGHFGAHSTEAQWKIGHECMVVRKAKENAMNHPDLILTLGCCSRLRPRRHPPSSILSFSLTHTLTKLDSLPFRGCCEMSIPTT